MLTQHILNSLNNWELPWSSSNRCPLLHAYLQILPSYLNFPAFPIFCFSFLPVRKVSSHSCLQPCSAEPKKTSSPLSIGMCSPHVATGQVQPVSFSSETGALVQHPLRWEPSCTTEMWRTRSTYIFPCPPITLASEAEFSKTALARLNVVVPS